jgi:hypothetical protein
MWKNILLSFLNLEPLLVLKITLGVIDVLYNYLFRWFNHISPVRRLISPTACSWQIFS